MNITQKAKSLVKKIANNLGFEIRRRGSSWTPFKPPCFDKLGPPWFVKKIVNSLGYELYWLPSSWRTLTPPYNLRIMAGPNDDAYYYAAVGEAFFKYCFKELCGLKPNENVLDVGCGCGNLAVPLTRYLHRTATYEGFDIIPESIEWCVTNISSKYPNFHFRLADIFNRYYNPGGQLKASEYRFPYPDEFFDFVFLKSVFTHMLPPDVENYFSEISRVLKKGKRCFITYFLLNAQSLAFIDAKLSILDFKYNFGNYRSIDESVPEQAVAYDEAYICKLYEKFGLKIVNPIHYGSWGGRKDSIAFQDFIIASKL